jgi:excisionase family DNA binding protein
MAETKRCLSVNDLAEAAGVSRALVYQMARSGQLKTVRFGSQKRGRVLIPSTEVDRILSPTVPELPRPDLPETPGS